MDSLLLDFEHDQGAPSCGPAPSCEIAQKQEIPEERKAAATYLHNLAGWLRDPKELKRQAILARQAIMGGGEVAPPAQLEEMSGVKNLGPVAK